MRYKLLIYIVIMRCIQELGDRSNINLVKMLVQSFKQSKTLRNHLLSIATNNT